MRNELATCAKCGFGRDLHGFSEYACAYPGVFKSREGDHNERAQTARRQSRKATGKPERETPTGRTAVGQDSGRRLKEHDGHD